MKSKNLLQKIGCMALVLLLFCISHVFGKTCGDVNSNGEINIVDALLIAQYYIGLYPVDFDEEVADVNTDRSIDIIDALLIAQYDVGLIDSLAECPDPTPVPGKPRVIVLTDNERDDRSCIVRFLYYLCDFDAIGIVDVVSRDTVTQRDIDWIYEYFDAYDQVLPNLRVHNPDYPDSSHLRNNLYTGNKNWNDMYTDPPDMEEQDTPGSDFIIDSLLEDDPRPIHIATWGGANTIAIALYRLKQDYSEGDFQRAVSKIRIYCPWYRDGGGQWIEDNIREAYILEAFGWDNTWDWGSTGGTNPPEQRDYMTSSWLEKNVLKNHGPLGELYGQGYVSEMDTTSFLHLINNGLNSDEDYTCGGWGGRAVYTDPSNKPNYLTDRYLNDDGSTKKHYWRWIIPAQNDFEARMDWGITSTYSEANHQPVAMVDGSYDIVPGGLGKTVAPGETVTISAASSSDPDGDNLSFKWWQYYEMDSASEEVSISNSTSSNASFVVPDEPGMKIHLILEVTDDGSPHLVGYQRLIFDIQ